MRKFPSKKSDKQHWDWDKDISTIGSSHYIRYLRMERSLSTGQSIVIARKNVQEVEIEFNDTDHKYLKVMQPKCENAKLKKISRYTRGAISLTVAKNDKDSQLKFIEIIASIICIDKIKKEILKDLKIPEIQDKDTVIQALTSLIRENNFNEALEEVLSLGDDILESDDILWVLGQHCEKSDKPEYASTLYSRIPETNPRYKDANRQLRHLTEKSENLDPWESLARQFKLMLKANNDSDADQKDIDSLFHQLTGDTNLTPDIHKVGCDPETLIKLAEQLRKEKSENQRLRARVSELTPRSVFSLFTLNWGRWSSQAPLDDKASSKDDEHGLKI